MQELIQLLGDPPFRFLSSFAIQGLTGIPHMLAGMIEVHDFNVTVTEAGNTVPNPLCAIAQDNDFLCLFESASRRLQVYMTGECLRTFEGDHLGDAYSLDL